MDKLTIRSFFKPIELPGMIVASDGSMVKHHLCRLLQRLGYTSSNLRESWTAIADRSRAIKSTDRLALIVGCFGMLIGLYPIDADAQPRIPPPPPPMAPEFFNPTYTDHRSDATCTGARMTLTWRYTASGLAVTSLTFRGVPARPGELKNINTWLADMRGDALARVETGNQGAVVAFVDAAYAGTPAPTVKFSWLENRANLLGQYRFK